MYFFPLNSLCMEGVAFEHTVCDPKAVWCRQKWAAAGASNQVLTAALVPLLSPHSYRRSGFFYTSLPPLCSLHSHFCACHLQALWTLILPQAVAIQALLPRLGFASTSKMVLFQEKTWEQTQWYTYSSLLEQPALATLLPLISKYWWA